MIFAVCVATGSRVVCGEHAVEVLRLLFHAGLSTSSHVSPDKVLADLVAFLDHVDRGKSSDEIKNRFKEADQWPGHLEAAARRLRRGRGSNNNNRVSHPNGSSPPAASGHFSTFRAPVLAERARAPRLL